MQAAVQPAQQNAHPQGVQSIPAMPIAMPAEASE